MNLWRETLDMLFKTYCSILPVILIVMFTYHDKDMARRMDDIDARLLHIEQDVRLLESVPFRDAPRNAEDAMLEAMQ